MSCAVTSLPLLVLLLSLCKPCLPLSPPNLPLSPPHLPLSPPDLPLSPAHLPLSPPNLPLSPPNLPLSPLNLPLSPPNLPLSPPHFPLSPPNLPLYLFNLPLSPPNLPLSSPHFPLSLPNLPLSPSNLPLTRFLQPASFHPLGLPAGDSTRALPATAPRMSSDQRPAASTTTSPHADTSSRDLGGAAQNRRLLDGLTPSAATSSLSQVERRRRRRPRSRRGLPVHDFLENVFGRTSGAAGELDVSGSAFDKHGGGIKWELRLFPKPALAVFPRQAMATKPAEVAVQQPFDSSELNLPSPQDINELNLPSPQYINELNLPSPQYINELNLRSPTVKQRPYPYQRRDFLESVEDFLLNKRDPTSSKGVLLGRRDTGRDRDSRAISWTHLPRTVLGGGDRAQLLRVILGNRAQLFRKSSLTGGLNQKPGPQGSWALHPTSQRNTSQRDTSQRNTSQRNTSQSNTSQNDTSQRNTSQRDTAPKLRVTPSFLSLWRYQVPVVPALPEDDDPSPWTTTTRRDLDLDLDLNSRDLNSGDPATFYLAALPTGDRTLTFRGPGTELTVAEPEKRSRSWSGSGRVKMARAMFGQSTPMTSGSSFSQMKGKTSRGDLARRFHQPMSLVSVTSMRRAGNKARGRQEAAKSRRRLLRLFLGAQPTRRYYGRRRQD